MRNHCLILTVLLSAVLAFATACSSAGNGAPNAAASSSAATGRETAAYVLSQDNLSSEELSSEDLSLIDLSYEVKLLLDPQKVLDDDHLLKEDWKQAFGITNDYLPIEVIYLETSEKDFKREGWINRLRLKSGKQKVECTFKKRYPVTGTEIAAACEDAKKDGFVLPDKTDKETGDNLFEAGIDWGYEEMTLSLSAKDSSKLKDNESLASLTDDEAKAFLLKAMPDIEADWKQSQWGITTLERSRTVGPIRFLRAKGNLENQNVTIEIWPVMDKDKDEEHYIVELSFKTDDFTTAAEGKAQIIDYLDQEGILLHEDSLKTTMILDAWF